jgi:hypothetical protein
MSIRGAAYAPPIESPNTTKEILGVVARERSTSRLVNLCYKLRSSETTKREVEPIARTHARVSRAVNSATDSAAGDPNSYFIRCFAYFTLTVMAPSLFHRML